MELLRSSELTVTEIAFDAGFSDSNYFARKFRQVVGTTPSAYRRMRAGASRAVLASISTVMN